MSDEVKPALTPEEWASFPNWPERITAFGFGWATEEAEKPVYFPTRHGIAAANLHGQPFGFTLDDVDTLRGMVDSDENPLTAPLEANDFLRSLAARIEALLPPEVPQ